MINSNNNNLFPLFILSAIFITITSIAIIASSTTIVQQEQQQRHHRRMLNSADFFAPIDEESDHIFAENEQPQQQQSPLSMRSPTLSIMMHHRRRESAPELFSGMESPQQQWFHTTTSDSHRDNGEIMVIEEENKGDKMLRTTKPQTRQRRVHHSSSFSNSQELGSPSIYGSGELLPLPPSQQMLLLSNRKNQKQLHRRNSSSAVATFIRECAKSVKQSVEYSLGCSTGKNGHSNKDDSSVKRTSEKELPKPAKRKSFRCDSRTMVQMSTLSFMGKDGVKKQVKVALEEPFNSGVQAQLYHGCVYIKSNNKSTSATHVGIKLIGLGTHTMSPGFKMLKKEQILEDPENEVKILRLFQDSRILASEEQRKHIIHMIDGGKFLSIRHPWWMAKKRKHLEDMYQFNVVEILELGGDNLMETFISTGKDGAEPEQVLIAILLEPAQVVVQVHQVVIHLDIKPQNFLYVDPPKREEKPPSATTTTATRITSASRELLESDNKTQILKAIDFGGSSPLPRRLVPGSQRGRTLEKLTCSMGYLPPEVDPVRLFNRHSIIKLKVTTKTDMWMFGMMIYHLVLFNMNPQKFSAKVDEDRRVDRMYLLLEMINKVYKKINDLTESDFTIVKKKASSTNSRRGKEISEEKDDADKEEQQIDVSSWPKLKEFVEREFPTKPHITFEQLLLESILQAKEQFPRLFLLISHLLLKNADHRLSAQGVVGFLSAKCKLMTASAFDFLWEEPKRVIGPLTTEVLEKMEGLSAELKEASIRATISVKTMVNAELTKLDMLPECDRSYRLGEEQMGEV